MKNFRGSALAAGVGTPESVPHELLGSSLHFYLVFKHRNCFTIAKMNISIFEPSPILAIFCHYDSVAASIFFIIANIMTAATRQRPMSMPQFAISGILFQSLDGIIER